jgi:hypothetical protein
VFHRNTGIVITQKTNISIFTTERNPELIFSPYSINSLLLSRAEEFVKTMKTSRVLWQPLLISLNVRDGGRVTCYVTDTVKKMF